MKERTSRLTDFAALMLFAVGAVCVLLVLLLGAKVYRNLVHDSNEHFEDRTAVQYVITRVRQAETVEIAEFDGCQALVIPEEINGETYLTRVYLYDGYLRELFCAADAALSAKDGEKLIPAEELCFQIDGTLLHARVNSRQVLLKLRCKEDVS